MAVNKIRLISAALVVAAVAAGVVLTRPPAKEAAPVQLARKRAPEATRCMLPTQAADAKHPGMVWVPGGSYEMGDTVYPEESPLQKVKVNGFWMDRTEVTNAEFAAFVTATAYVTDAERGPDPKLQATLPPDMRLPGAVVFVAPANVNNQGSAMQWWRYVPGADWRHPAGPATGIEGRDSFPVVAVSYADAKAYAKWKGRALPSEAQWEWAARAGQPQASKDHAQPKDANSWQGIFPTLNSAEDGFTGLAPVGCYAANAYGLFDMIGNVWEFTTDAWRPFHGDPADGKPDQSPRMLEANAAQRVIKGGSYLCSPDYCMRYRAGARQPQDEDLGASHLGFRTVLLAPGP
ncbi:MAG: formylglycine-generating enzyme family protein [Pseudomonadota bacterium]